MTQKTKIELKLKSNKR